MKNSIFLIILIFLAFQSNSQPPKSFNYQAIARNSYGQVIINQAISVKFSILDVSSSGTVLYAETQSTTTNNFGLFTLAIGQGTIVSGSFSSINWGLNSKYLKVEIDPTGGTSYTLQGTTQFLSVPYALYAGTAANSTDSCAKWFCDNNGIFRNGNVGIGAPSLPGNVKLSIDSGSMHLKSSDPYQTALFIGNRQGTSPDTMSAFTFVVGGRNNNNGVGPRNFGSLTITRQLIQQILKEFSLSLLMRKLIT